MKTCPTCHQTYSDDVEFCPRDGAPLAAEAREERECPYCAERILRKARVCKHCGHDVEPLAGTGIDAQTPPPAPQGRIGEPPSAQPQGNKPPQFQTVPKPPSKMKFVVIAVVALIVIVAGVWYFSQHGPKKGEVRVNPKDGLKYVWIPPGTFMMGCSPGDTDCEPEEKPPHQVTITKGFWLGQTKVTVGAYKRFAGATGRQMPPEPSLGGRPLNPGWGNEAMPIVDVTWDDAKAYCGWAGGRLPTEAEWEYAARGGSTAARYGDLDGIAWYADNSGGQRLDSDWIWKEDQANYEKRLGDNGNGMHEVGQKRANGFGLYDMLGNVWEWVNDWYDEKYYQNSNYYQNSPSQDPTGPASGTLRGLRGGSWGGNPRGVRVSIRDWSGPGFRDGLSGFRCGTEEAPRPTPPAQTGQGMGTETKKVPETPQPTGGETPQPTVTEPQTQPVARPAAGTIKTLQEQAAKNPQDPGPRVKLANYYYDQRQFQPAAEWYQKALGLDPKNVDARTDLGTTYFYLGRPQDALREYEKTLQTDPKHEPAMLNLIVVHLESTHDLAAAQQAWDRLHRQNPNYPGLDHLKQRLDAARASARP